MTPKEPTIAELKAKLAKEESDAEHRKLYDKIVEYCHKHFASKRAEILVYGFVSLVLTAFVIAWIATVLK